MLWTLHNRASEALRTDAWLRDPEAVRIYRAIAYDYERSFGRPDASHAVRSQIFDEAVRPWMAAHPGGTVVELGCGLETQFQRLDDGCVRWLCVDVPEAIEIRERFLAPGGRCRHLRRSALDPAWMDEVDPGRGVFVTAQGLLMYFEEYETRALLTAILDRFPGVDIMFDTIPRWFSRKTLTGLWKTRHYRTPPMPWGVNRDEIEPLLHDWSPRVRSVNNMPYRRLRSFPACLFPWLMRLPGLGKFAPAIVHVRSAPESPAPRNADASISHPDSRG